LKIQLLILWTF